MNYIAAYAGAARRLNSYDRWWDSVWFFCLGSLASSYGLSPWVRYCNVGHRVRRLSAICCAWFNCLACADLGDRVDHFYCYLRHLLYAADLVKFVKHLPMPIRAVMVWVDWWNLCGGSPMLWKLALQMKEIGHKVYLGLFIFVLCHVECYDNIGVFYPWTSFQVWVNGG